MINCEYFNNLNVNGDMAGTSICTSPYPSPYPTEKVGDSPYPYPYPVNAGIPRQNRDGFRQYPRERGLFAISRNGTFQGNKRGKGLAYTVQKKLNARASLCFFQISLYLFFFLFFFAFFLIRFF